MTHERARETALADAIGALHRRERTVAELHAWLSEREIEEELAGDVSPSWSSSASSTTSASPTPSPRTSETLSGWGAERIEAALVDRGLGRSLAELAAAEPREAQLERAASLLARRGEDLEDEAGRARALGFLTRRGYEYELAYDAIRRAAA